jgi:hypothetical protein
MSMQIKNLTRLDASKREAIQTQAARLRSSAPREP